MLGHLPGRKSHLAPAFPLWAPRMVLAVADILEEAADAGPAAVRCANRVGSGRLSPHSRQFSGLCSELHALLVQGWAEKLTISRLNAPQERPDHRDQPTLSSRGRNPPPIPNERRRPLYGEIRNRLGQRGLVEITQFVEEPTTVMQTARTPGKELMALIRLRVS